MNNKTTMEEKIKNIAEYLNCNAEELVSEVSKLLALAETEAYKKGKADGMTEEALGCFNHCEQAKLEVKREILNRIDNFLASKYEGVERISDFHEKGIRNILLTEPENAQRTGDLGRVEWSQCND